MSRSWKLPVSMALAVAALLSASAPAIADDALSEPPAAVASVSDEADLHAPAQEYPPAQPGTIDEPPVLDTPPPGAPEEGAGSDSGDTGTGDHAEPADTGDLAPPADAGDESTDAPERPAEVQAVQAVPPTFAADDPEVLKPPVFSVVGANESAAYFNWRYAAGDPGVTGEVLVTVWDAETDGASVKTCKAPAPNTYCVVYGLTLYQKYWASVQRIAPGGAASEPSDRVMIQPRKLPENPRNIDAGIVGDELKVSWTKSPDPILAPVTRYTVWIGAGSVSNGGTGYSFPGTQDSATFNLNSSRFQSLHGKFVAVRVTSENVVGESSLATAPEKTLTQRVPLTGVEPKFGPSTRTADGFTVELDEVEPGVTYDVSTSVGTVTRNDTVITVSGLVPGALAYLQVTTHKTGHFSRVVQTSGQAGFAPVHPEFDTPIPTVDGFTVKISNFDAQTRYELDPPPSPATPVAATLDGDTITVTGLEAGKSASVRVTTSRPGWNPGVNSVVGRALRAPSSIPTFASGKPEPRGFSVYIANYDWNRTYRFVTEGNVTASANGGYVYVSGVEPNREATIQVFSTLPGEREAGASYTGRAAKNPPIAFSLTGVSPTADGWTSRIVSFSALESTDSFTAVTSAGTVTVVDRVVTVTGLAPDEMADVTVTMERSDTESSTARAQGRALQEHTVTFDAGLGAPTTSTAAVTHGSPVKLPAPPIRDRYAFTGWFTDADVQTPYHPDAPVTASVTLYAGWEVSSYAVTWDTNRDDASPTETLLIDGTTLGALPTPTAPGAVIREWNTQADGAGTAVHADTLLASIAGEAELTLYAIWETRSLALTFAPGRAVSATATAGDTVLLRATANAPFGGTVDVSDEAEITSTVGSDVVVKSEVRVKTVGSRTLAGVFDGATATATLDVVAGPLGTLTLTPNQGSIEQGSSLDFTVTGSDSEGNSVAIDPADVTLRSADAGDRVAGLKVSFATAGVRQITATVAGAAAPPVSVAVTVSPRYTVAWDENWNGADAPEVEVVTAERLTELPDPSAAGWVITGWNTAADGSGAFVSTDTPLASVATGPELTLYAIWEKRTLELTPATNSPGSGDTIDVAALANAPFGGTVDVTAEVALESSDPTDIVSGSTVRVLTVGPRTVTGKFDGATASIEFAVAAGPVADLTVTPSAMSVPRGGTLEFTVSGVDAANNPVEIGPEEVTLSSDVLTDVVDGLSVTFPTASPHVITAHAGEVSASVTIEVREDEATPPGGPSDPDPADPALARPIANDAQGSLATTGGLPVLGLASSAVVLLVVGGILLGRRRTT